MSNVLDDTTQQQIRALGRLGWTLSPFEETTGVRRENHQRLSESCRKSCARPRPAERIETKACNSRRPGVHRPPRVETGHQREVSTDWDAISRPSLRPARVRASRTES